MLKLASAAAPSFSVSSMLQQRASSSISALATARASYAATRAFSTSLRAQLATPVDADKPKKSVGGFAISSAPRITYTYAPPSQPATLHLKTGQSFPGKSFGHPETRFGETVFTTSITSYTESLTDPSYQGQLLTFTQPLMGNYGVPDNFGTNVSPHGHPLDVNVGSLMESTGVQAAGVIVSNLTENFSHFEAKESLATWCARHGVPGISGIDTRALTTLLRDQGSTLGAIKIGAGHEQPPANSDFYDPMGENLIEKVSTKQPYTIHPVGGASAAKVHVALLDFGCKANILRSLLRRGATVTVLPWNYDFNPVRDNFDGLFLSNGPGSPYSIPSAVGVVKKAIDEWNRPIFGICMGHQIIGLAAGIKAYRMKFGNRGHNQPVVAISTHGSSVKAGRVYITSQNHGYALKFEESARTIEDGKWPDGWEPWFVNANDGSIEGIRLSPKIDRKPVWAVQFHPEHAGGPEDCSEMFTDYVTECIKAKEERGQRDIGAGIASSFQGPVGTGLKPSLIEVKA
ncbi:small subunit of carbamoyl phosphate synthase [Tilletiaria anomala UBC 951]|uniref:Carbamoyl phosphate synthase arginine-specific small chain n=1 Tax=Tilletiaria anomala (strain ATCC 24038 / CBS 436.72 / UBC 951) TaxID=1037660 RepID=A0A066WGY2_TILAU|nr:small subunit of carbamoyl phosphate synthase [Tilletiaria anomala UBC 951]KDN53252.1 small subunit of carbamoyl phosphate synthase [Tilletiaria anomala UBC 951]